MVSVHNSSRSLYVDEKGHTTFAAPAAVITVNGDTRTREKGLYDVRVDAQEVPGQYPTSEPVEPGQKSEYTVIFVYGYDGKR